jgi:HEAT repeat protein
MFALSRSDDNQAIPELIRFAREDTSPAVRGEAIFWLAQKAGQKAQAQISSSIDNDPDTDVKKRAVFALSQLPKDQGVPLLIQVAKTNKNPAVRKQAMFWLGQSRDPRALDFFAEVLGK